MTQTNKMNKSKWFGILLPVILFLILSFAYFSPLLKGEVIKTQDITMHRSMAKEVTDFAKKTGENSLWLNGTFSGMPAYLIQAKYSNNWIQKLVKPILKIPRPASYLFLYFLFFYVLLLLLKCKPWVSFVGALAYGFNSAFFIWMSTGHMTKALTLTFMAVVVAGVLLAYNKKALLGSVLAAFGLSWMIGANHPQITYYAGLMTLVLVATYFVYALKEKALLPFFKASGFLLLGALLAVGTNYSRLATTMEYGKYSTRGQSELSDASGQKTTGLDKDYILDYSYNVGEAFSAFIPRFKGGGNAEPVGEKSHVYKLIAKQDKRYAKQVAQHLPLYWGSQPIVGAPFYFGAVLCFLFVFGLFVVKGKDKWWLALTVLLAFLLSLGKYFPGLSNFMLDYFPGYNKFRDVKNIIVIQQFAMALLGVLAIREVLKPEGDKKLLWKGLKYAFAITGGFALLFAIAPGLAGDFSGSMDAGMGSEEIVNALKADRRMVLQADAFRSFLFVGFAALSLWALFKQKLKAQYALAIWAVLILADMWTVNKKYLNNDNFQAKRKSAVVVQKTEADKYILQDQDPHYRVLNLTVNPFSDGTTSYYHNSIGGYHGAKLERYQELIEYGISPEIQQMQKGFSKVQSQLDVDQLFAGLKVLNMLDTRYIIHNAQAAPLVNNSALGAAWFVPEIRFVENADAEIRAIRQFDPAKEALVDQRFSAKVKTLNYQVDSSASLQLLSYLPNYAKYKTANKNDAFAVFSEIYYPAGWYASIDGEPADIIRANYVLRGLNIPAGEHVVEFSFQPETYAKGEKISLASSVLLLLMSLGIVFVELKKRKEA